MLLLNRFTLWSKMLGLTLATLLVVTLLQFASMPERASAAEGTGTGTNSGTQTPAQVTTVTLSAEDASDGAHTVLTATVDADLDDAGTSLSLYRVGSSTVLQSINSGTSHDFTVDKPASGVDEYYVKVDSLISNTVGVSAGTWRASLSTSTPEFPNTGPLPVLSTTLNQSLSGSGFRAYFVDTTSGHVLTYGLSAGTSGSAAIERFYIGSAHTYKVYIAATQDYATSFSQLTNVQAISNSVKVARKPWNITAALDKTTYASDEANPILTWTTNQPIGQDVSMAVWVINTSTDTVISREYPLSTTATTGQVSLPKSSLGQRNDFIVEVAPYQNDGNYTQYIHNIQATSNSVSTARDAWAVSASLDKSVFSVEENAPVLTWTTNQGLAETGNTYNAYLIDVATQQIVGRTNGNTSGRSGTFNTPKFQTGGPHQYKVVIARTLDTRDSDATHLQQEAASASLTTSRAAWGVIASVDHTVKGVEDPAPVLTWSTGAQRLSASGYRLFLVNTTTNRIENATNNYNPGGSAGTWNLAVPHLGGQSYTYKVVVANVSSYYSDNADDLTDIQASSQTVTVSSQIWNVSLELVSSTPQSSPLSFTWHTNQRPNTGGFGVYLVDTATNKVIGQNWTQNTTSGNFMANSSPTSGPYLAYVADWYQASGTDVSNLQGITAISNVVNPELTSSTQSLPGETRGGGSTSEANCQQCIAHPVNTYSGEEFENATDLTINSVIPFEVTRSYSSTIADKLGPLGYGWTNNYSMRLTQVDGLPAAASLGQAKQLSIVQENGSLARFYKLADGTYAAPARTFAKLTYDATNNSFVMIRSNGYRFRFSDNTGRLQSIRDRNDNSLALSYTNGKLDQILSSDGKSVNFNWTGDLLHSITDNASRTITYTYDGNSNLTGVSALDASNGYSFEYDSAHMLTGVTPPDQGKTTTSYYNGRVSMQTRPDGSYYTFQYDVIDGKNVTTVRIPDGTSIRYVYNAGAQLASETKAYGSTDAATTSYLYGPTSQVIQATSPTGAISSFTYDDAGNMLSATDALSHTTNFTYNGFNQLRITTDALQHTAENTYDASGNLTSSKDFEGKITKYDVNPNGTVHTVQSPNSVAADDNKLTVYGYDTNKFVNAITSPNGNTSQLTNNALGQPLTATDADSKTTTYTYDPQTHQLTDTLLPNNGTTHRMYNQQTGQLMLESDVTGNISFYHYNSLGQLSSVFNTGTQLTTVYTYEPMGQLKTEMTIPSGPVPNPAPVITYTHDGRGNLTKVQSLTGKITEYTYYLNDQLKTTKLPSGIITTNAYDAVGNLKTVTTTSADGTLSAVTTADYDELNRAKWSENTAHVRASYEYDNNGRLTKTTRNDSTTLKTAYDDNGNVETTTNADNTTVGYTYDADDNVLTKQDELQHTTTYHYNTLDQLIQQDNPGGTHEYMNYTAMGQVKQQSHDNWQSIDTEYTYNLRGQPLTETQDGTTTQDIYTPYGALSYRGPPVQNNDLSHGVQYGYDARLRQNEIVYPGGLDIAYGYDLSNNLKTVKQGSATLASYTLNADEQVAAVAYGNGTTQTYGYDKLGRGNATDVSKGSNSLYSKSLTLNADGLITASTTTAKDTGGNASTNTQTYSYDPLQQLQTVSENNTDTGYAFDNRGNLITKGAATLAYDTVGKLLASTAGALKTTYDYDARGNRIAASTQDVSDAQNPVALGTLNSSWTHDDRLASAANQYATYGYSYDTLGLLTKKTTTVAGSTTSPTQSGYVWDTTNSVPTMLSDGAHQYVYGADSTPFLQLDSSGNSTYLYGDDLGSVVLAADSSGDQVAQYAYDAYGNTTTHTGDNSNHQATPFAYAGEYRDQDTGLYYLRARWYDPSSGSFLSLDPLVEKTKNGYSYAGQNPLSNVDPLGLDFWKTWDATWNAQLASYDRENRELGQASLGSADIITMGASTALLDQYAPGAIDHCDTAFAWGQGATMVAMLLIPAGGEALDAVNGTRLAATAAETGLRSEGTLKEVAIVVRRHLEERLEAEAPGNAAEVREALRGSLTPHGRNFNVPDRPSLEGVERVLTYRAKEIPSKISEDRVYEHADGTRIVVRAKSSQNKGKTLQIEEPSSNGSKNIYKVHMPPGSGSE